MRQISLDLLCLGEQLSDAASELVGHRSMALCLYHLGEFRSAQEHLERVLGLYVPGAHHPLASIAAFDMRAAALSYLSLSLLILGHPEQARHWSEQALTWSRSLQHPHTLAFSLNYACYFHLLGRAGSSVEGVLEELRWLAVEQRFPIWLVGADIMGGYVLALHGRAADGLALARKGLTERKATGSNWHETFLLGLLAPTAHSAGQPDEAHSLLDAALAMADRTGERWYEAELHRVKGDLQLTQGHRDQVAAETSFRQAVTVARNQDARFWELRAATSLGRLWAKQGKRREAHDLLAPIYGWFTEGFDTADLKDAKALLDKLA
jgi:predicted ATPase